MAPKSLLRLAVGVALLLPAAGCSWRQASQPQRLYQRLSLTLRPQVADGQATVARVGDDVRVTLAYAPMFQPGSPQLNSQGEYTLASVIQGLFTLDHTAMVVDACPGGPPPGTECQFPLSRADSMIGYFEKWGFNPNLVSSGVAPPSATVPGRLPEPQAVLDIRTLPPPDDETDRAQAIRASGHPVL
jgi:hypothetical protein